MDAWSTNNSHHTTDTHDLSTMRAASSTQPSYMREGLSAWYVTVDPLVWEAGTVDAA
jgi:hypothetical protein